MLIFMLVKTSNRNYLILISFFLIMLSAVAQSEEWKFDFSRRVKESSQPEAPSSTDKITAVKTFFTDLFDSTEPQQEIVLLNTEKGFVPSTVRVRQGGNYRIHIVNVNEKEKNVSFVLDAFSEHHATYFGKIKTFDIRPKKNGVFRFVSPETSAQGSFVVLPGLENSTNSVPMRQPAAEE